MSNQAIHETPQLKEVPLTQGYEKAIKYITQSLDKLRLLESITSGITMTVRIKQGKYSYEMPLPKPINFITLAEFVKQERNIHPEVKVFTVVNAKQVGVDRKGLVLEFKNGEWGTLSFRFYHNGELLDTAYKGEVLVDTYFNEEQKKTPYLLVPKSLTKVGKQYENDNTLEKVFFKSGLAQFEPYEESTEAESTEQA